MIEESLFSPALARGFDVVHDVASGDAHEHSGIRYPGRVG